MKSFLYLALTIFFFIFTALAFNHLDPGAKNNLNTTNVIAVSSLLFASLLMLYLSISSFFNLGKRSIYHGIRAVLLALLVVGLFLLKIFNLFTLPVFIIFVFIYILSEITLYELNKK